MENSTNFGSKNQLCVKCANDPGKGCLSQNHKLEGETCWSTMQEAAKQRCKDIVDVLKKDGNLNIRDKYWVTPLGVTAECGHCDVLEHLNHNGGHIKALANDCVPVLFQAAGGCSLDCIALLLKYGGSGNVPGEAGLLRIHKVAYEGHHL